MILAVAAESCRKKSREKPSITNKRKYLVLESPSASQALYTSKSDGLCAPRTAPPPIFRQVRISCDRSCRHDC